MNLTNYVGRILLACQYALKNISHLFLLNVSLRVGITSLIILLVLAVAASAREISRIDNARIDTTREKIFKLGEVTVTADKYDEIFSRINAVEMERENKMEVSKALNNLSGISLTASGSRNESMVSVRGFDLRQVPVYMDGIPVYVPYDGYVDLARFTTFDLAAVNVSKGNSSVLYGPNSLGGAINLISRKPDRNLEYDGSIGSIGSNGWKGNINIGAKIYNFYIQGGASALHRNSFATSSKFDSTKWENGGYRDNSYRNDQKYSVKIGWTPDVSQEYAVGYIKQRGEKGTPLYCGADALNPLYSKPRFWQWPYWNTETFYYLSKTKLDANNSIKAQAYYSAFKNSINSFDDATYSTQKKTGAFQSFYDDFSYGGDIEYGVALPKHSVNLALHYKEDVHRENNAGEPIRKFEDNTITIAVEDKFVLSDDIILMPGASYSSRKNKTAQDYDAKLKEMKEFPEGGASPAYNAQLSLLYNLFENSSIGAFVSYKTRFATIKDRYSYRMGSALPNPDLKPESAINYELNYSVKYFRDLIVQAAVFYSDLSDAMIDVSNVASGKSQLQNAGKAEYMGFEADFNYSISNNARLNANYTYLKRNNLTNPNIYFTDVPNSKFIGGILYKPIDDISVGCNIEYNSSRFSKSYGGDSKTEGYMLANMTVSGKIWKRLALDFGVNNIFDKNYSIVEGYPEEGRCVLITMRFFN